MTGSEPAVLALPAALGLTAATPLAAELATVQGSPVLVDASGVERLGALCLQVLLSASASWAAAGQPFEIRDASPAFREAWGLLGAPPLKSTMRSDGVAGSSSRALDSEI